MEELDRQGSAQLDQDISMVANDISNFIQEREEAYIARQNAIYNEIAIVMEDITRGIRQMRAELAGPRPGPRPRTPSWSSVDRRSPPPRISLCAHRIHVIRSQTPDSEVSDLEDEYRLAAFHALHDDDDMETAYSS
jgi:hypothetical protein